MKKQDDTLDHSAGTPPTSAALSSTSAATGQMAPTSSRRCRRSSQPTGRGRDVNNALIVPISLRAML
jgi:hypothetical protein